MKNTMRKLTAALLALTCLPVTGLTAAADSLPWYWGTTTWDAVEDMELMGQGDYFAYKDSQLYLRNTERDDDIVLVSPRSKVMRFVLRDEVEPEEGGKQIAEVLDAYFPGLQESYDALSMHADIGNAMLSHEWDVSDQCFELLVTASPENASAIEADVLLALARRHLISEFYGWGETARYQVGYFGGLEEYPSSQQKPTDVSGHYIEVETDWTAVQSYLEEHHPGYSAEKFLVASINNRDNDGNVTVEEIYQYRITGADALSRKEQIELSCELWEQFDICPSLMLLEAAEAQSIVGRNALEQPGDVTLDCEIDIMDVIALNKYLLSVTDLCNTAKGNADLNGDGTPDAVDALNLLKKVAGIADTSEET